ncbi:MAG: nucleoside triphosphate pyrophosphohydrolase [Rhizobiaceae bacterium]|nr:nucleoside triphosphate pyrophosphohydrolase [Hyphomicrobiales bacterium]NRB31074.1 nucleoside triphosphate pyrophosphohydrolase [Rhizobiaceae bacterium]
MKPSRDAMRLVEIMAALRTPVTGCPWDLEQNFRSITPYTIEEVYEVVDAIERDDMENLREELGDLLLQVVYHSRMAEEDGAFDFADVVETVTTKMIRRHPHVFGDETARSAGMAKGAWERIKAIEKQERAERRAEMGLPPAPEAKGLLDQVPAATEPMLEALKLQQKASKVGFDWNDPNSVMSKIREELEEVEAEIKQGETADLESEIGDVLFAAINLARHLDIDPGNALRSCNRKFRTRFAHIEATIGDHGETLESADLDLMERLWVDAKTASKS